MVATPKFEAPTAAKPERPDSRDKDLVIQSVTAQLMALGILTPGKSYETAVKQFQSIHGLKMDGVVGPQTLGALWPEPIEGRNEVPTTPAPKNGWPRQSSVPSFYGRVGENQVTFNLPWSMYLAWDKGTVIRKFSCHKKVLATFQEAFEKIGQEYDKDQRRSLGLDLFGGCLNVRKMRGGSAWSMHSWGIAIDFDPGRNQLKWGKDKARLAKPDCERFWRIWEELGGVSLGRQKNYDWMHVQMAKL